MKKKHEIKGRADYREFLDYDYLDKLSPTELEFLQNFSNKYYQYAISGRAGRRKDVYSNMSQTQHDDAANCNPQTYAAPTTKRTKK